MHFLCEKPDSKLTNILDCLHTVQTKATRPFADIYLEIN